jgi:hypothetical protein
MLDSECTEASIKRQRSLQIVREAISITLLIDLLPEFEQPVPNRKVVKNVYGAIKPSLIAFVSFELFQCACGMFVS